MDVLLSLSLEACLQVTYKPIENVSLTGIAVAVLLTDSDLVPNPDLLHPDDVSDLIRRQTPLISASPTVSLRFSLASPCWPSYSVEYRVSLFPQAW